MVQMPAVNTPQFDWIKSNMPRHPQPVPPIFQPEVAADAIVWAAHHKRRELYVGSSSVEAIVGTKIAPGLLDVYLAKSAYSGQQTDELADQNQPNNLWSPVPGDYGAHGSFDDRAQDYSAQLWATKNQDWLTLAVGAGVACLALGAYIGSQPHPKSADEDEITKAEIHSETARRLHQDLNRSSQQERMSLLMRLARWGWKSLNKTDSQSRSNLL